MFCSELPKAISGKEQIELLEKYILEGDINARNRVIETNIRLAIHISKKYDANYSDFADEIISSAIIGLIKAVDSFKLNKGAKPATYFGTCINNEILLCIRRIKRNISNAESLDEYVVDKDGKRSPRHDFIVDGKSILDDDDTLIGLELNQTLKSMKLNEKEKTIIALRYAISEPLTQLEVSEKLGLSQSYVSRIEKQIIKKLRRKFEVVS